MIDTVDKQSGQDQNILSVGDSGAKVLTIRQTSSDKDWQAKPSSTYVEVFPTHSTDETVPLLSRFEQNQPWKEGGDQRTLDELGDESKDIPLDRDWLKSVDQEKAMFDSMPLSGTAVDESWKSISTALPSKVRFVVWRHIDSWVKHRRSVLVQVRAARDTPEYMRWLVSTSDVM